VVRVEDALAEALPGVEPRSVKLVDEGWDSIVAVVDVQWVLRVARAERFANSYALEAALTTALWMIVNGTLRIATMAQSAFQWRRQILIAASTISPAPIGRRGMGRPRDHILVGRSLSGGGGGNGGAPPMSPAADNDPADVPPAG